MFICGICQVVTPPRTPLHLHVAEVRRTEYINQVPDPDNDNPLRTVMIPKVSRGSEIVREVNCCPACKATLELVVQ